MKTTIEKINSMLEEAEDQTSDREDKVAVIAQSEEQKIKIKNK